MMRFVLAVLATCLTLGAAQAPYPSFSTLVQLSTEREVLGQGGPLANPDAAANASGTALIEFVGSSRTIHYVITFQDLSEPQASTAHFHGPATKFETAGVALVISAGQFDSPFSSDPQNGDNTLDDMQVQQLFDNLWYVNIHTGTNLAGEIRGQIYVPLPSSFSSTIQLTTQAELAAGTPLAVPSMASGSALVSWDELTSTMSWTITFAGLSSTATALHFHGPATESGGAGVRIFAENNTFVSPHIGSVVLNGQHALELGQGMWYINLHTLNNPMGELRGQVVTHQPEQSIETELATVYRATVPLSPAAVVAGGGALAVRSAGSGTAIVQLTTTAPRIVSWSISFQDLTADTTAAHFHGPASASEMGPVALLIADSIFATPNIGSAEISEAQAQELLDGMWYVNIHSDFNGPGEIRGQVEGFQMVEVALPAIPSIEAEVAGPNSASKLSFASALFASAVTALLLN